MDAADNALNPNDGVIRDGGNQPPVIFVNDRRVQEIGLDLREGNVSLTFFLTTTSGQIK